MADNQVATVDPKGSAVAVYDYGDDAGVGFEGTKLGDFKPSFLRVLQGLSPAVSDGLPGAKPGIIHDSITNEMFETVDFVPAVREHVYVAWKPRTEGGGGGEGFGGVYQLSDPMVIAQLAKHLAENPDDKFFARGEDGKIIIPRTPDGVYQLIETVYFHGVQVLNQAAFIPVTLPFSSTGMPVAQSWFTTMRRQMIPDSAKPYPLFAHAFKMGSIKKTVANKTWFIYTQTWLNGTAEKSRLAPNSELYLAAKSVSVAFKEGTAKVDYAASGGSGEGQQASAADKQKASDKDIPF